MWKAYIPATDEGYGWTVMENVSVFAIIMEFAP